MELPPSSLTSHPTDDQVALAAAAHMEYKAEYLGGVLQRYKLKHKKSPRPCKC